MSGDLDRRELVGERSDRPGHGIAASGRVHIDLTADIEFGSVGGGHDDDGGPVRALLGDLGHVQRVSRLGCYPAAQAFFWPVGTQMWYP